jgi:Tfp pilus assembly protein PilZ
MSEPSQSPEPARVPYVAHCQLQSGAVVVHGLLCDLSPFGCFVHLEPPIEGEVEISFALPDGGPPVRATAAVTWIRREPAAEPGSLPVGSGMRFAVMPPGDRRRVETFVDAFQRSSAELMGAEQPRSESTRVPLVVPCRLTGASGTADGRTCNLSIFGIYAAVHPVPGVGEAVWVQLWLPGRPEPFTRKATVTWRNDAGPSWRLPLPPGCGVKFEELSIKDVRVLSRIVEEGLANRSADTR